MKLFQAYMRLLILLSLTATSLATPNAKTGCSDTCGNNVTIPYPFGIGTECSINHWYTVVCKSSRPYLNVSALHQLEVLRVNMTYQEVVVDTTSISYCSDPGRKSSQITSIDLGDTPFWFSELNNIFVFEGSCGSATMINNKNATTCSTSCLNNNNVTVTETTKGNFVSDRCIKNFDHPFQYYSINQTSSGRDAGCGYGMLVDEVSYDTENTSVASVPISLFWTLNDIQNCCPAAEKGNVTIGMECKVSGIYTGNPYLSDGCEVREECASCPEDCIKYRNTTTDDAGLNRRVTYNYTCPHNYPLHNSGRKAIGVILGN
ncbi:wall-associated receptor kinase-like 8 [Bidens hawaiensis]|uniref:wall-associated receptor kinase-like 8 n=1 Tax=Bidens hawaiensis TaxID=980011 RepID=UPI00404B5C64